MFVKILFIFTILSMIGYHKVLADKLIYINIKDAIHAIDKFRITDFEDMNLHCYYSMFYYIFSGDYIPYNIIDVIDKKKLEDEMDEINDYYFNLLTLTTMKIENIFQKKLWEFYKIIKNWKIDNLDHLEYIANKLLTSNGKYLTEYTINIKGNSNKIDKADLRSIINSYNFCKRTLKSISRELEKGLGEPYVIYFSEYGYEVPFPGVIMKLMTKDEFSAFKSESELQQKQRIVEIMQQTLSEIYLGINYVLNKIELFNIWPNDSTTIVQDDKWYITGLKLYSIYKLYKNITDVSRKLKYLLLRYYQNTRNIDLSYNSFVKTFQDLWSNIILKDGENKKEVNRLITASISISENGRLIKQIVVQPFMMNSSIGIPENDQLFKQYVVRPSMMNYYAIMFKEDWINKTSYTINNEIIFLMELRGWLEFIKYYTNSMLNSTYTQNPNVESIYQKNQEFIESRKFDIDGDKIEKK